MLPLAQKESLGMEGSKLSYCRMTPPGTTPRVDVEVIDCFTNNLAEH